MYSNTFTIRKIIVPTLLFGMVSLMPINLFAANQHVNNIYYDKNKVSKVAKQQPTFKHGKAAKHHPRLIMVSKSRKNKSLHIQSPEIYTHTSNTYRNKIFSEIQSKEIIKANPFSLSITD